ncbi:hypothetical protein F2Q68_00042231 [Brassica cretica]|uniref:RRM domain-containing protein n=1 Tax=Brassica cretica TaxID=69181 RepID=A0A8S9MJB9_BRACR|nr:hypothetical protein F2Q68_00042231 [Brassica cretica]
MGNHKLKWTEEEEEALLAGVQKHGPKCFAARSIDKVRTPKIKAAALNLAAVAAAATSTPPPSSATPSPVAPLPRSGSSDLNVDDSWNTMVDAKNAPRYDGMIFEALSALTDPSGSDVTTIFNFIEEKKHEVPPTFKRVLGSRLRRLAAQGKIEKVNQIRAGTQNFYRMNGTSFSGMRAPVVARPKEVNVKPRQTNSQRVLTVSQRKVDQASGTAAFKLAEVEKNLELVKRAAEHKERMIKLAEQAEIILLLAEELHEAYFVLLQIEPIPSGNLPPGFDPTSCRSVYVGNVHIQVTEPLLQEVFASTGPVESCKLIRKEQSSYGFVHYFDRRSAGLAILSLNGRHLFGQPIKVNWAYASGQREDTSAHFNIFVGDLSPEVTDAMLFSCFSVYPSCSDARVMWDQKTGRSRGFGFVSFRNQQDAQTAIDEAGGMSFIFSYLGRIG